MPRTEKSAGYDPGSASLHACKLQGEMSRRKRHEGPTISIRAPEWSGQRQVLHLSYRQRAQKAAVHQNRLPASLLGTRPAGTCDLLFIRDHVDIDNPGRAIVFVAYCIRVSLHSSPEPADLTQCNPQRLALYSSSLRCRAWRFSSNQPKKRSKLAGFLPKQ